MPKDDHDYKDFDIKTIRPYDMQISERKIDEQYRELSKGIQDILIKLAVLNNKLENQSSRHEELSRRIKECEDDIEQLQQKLRDTITARDSKWIGYLVSLIVAFVMLILGYVIKL